MSDPKDKTSGGWTESSGSYDQDQRSDGLDRNHKSVIWLGWLDVWFMSQNHAQKLFKIGPTLQTGPQMSLKEISY